MSGAWLPQSSTILPLHCMVTEQKQHNGMPPYKTANPIPPHSCRYEIMTKRLPPPAGPKA